MIAGEFFLLNKNAALGTKIAKAAAIMCVSLINGGDLQNVETMRRCIFGKTLSYFTTVALNIIVMLL